jgi:CheY-like chemotaxis protein
MSKTLLLADDSVTIQKVVAISFASEDIAITTVDNGDDAITRARELRPDVILADVVMPGRSGYEVCEAIKAEPTLRHIPVLLLTGTFEAFDEQRAQRAGAAGHVAKPFEAQALVQRVRELLDAPAAPPAPAPPIAEAPAGPAAESRREEDAFAFFEDEPAADEPFEEEIDGLSTEELELAPGDSAFSFGDEDFGRGSSDPVLSPAREPAQPVAHTVAILPETPAEAGPQRGGETVIAPPTESAPPAADDRFDFEFESVAPSSGRDTQMDSFAEGALLDPQADSGFVDPAPSGFEVPAGLEMPPGDATQILGSDFDVSSPEALAPAGSENAADPLDDDDSDPFAPDPVEAAPESRDEFFEELPPAPPAAPIEEPGPAFAAPEPRLATPVDDLAEPEPDPGASDDFGASSPERFEPAAPAAEAAAPAPDREAIADAILRQVQPQLQAQVHETLERIAWEAFGQVTEKIVAQAVEKLETITWEVVPKLAETLIQEEIRKLKGE